MSMNLLPASFLFRYTLPVRCVDRLPRAKAPLIELPQSCECPWPSTMDSEPFAAMRLAWNSEGFAISVSVTGKTNWPSCAPERLHSSDGVQLWLDTRDTQNIHRASRYCHHFVVTPIGGGSDGKAPLIGQFPIARAGDDAPEADLETILLESDADESGYRVSIWFPTAALYGFDPETYSRMGFYIVVRDQELGTQYLSVDEEFPYSNDPSLWASLKLNRDD